MASVIAMTFHEVVSTSIRPLKKGKEIVGQTIEIVQDSGEQVNITMFKKKIHETERKDV